MPYDPERLRRSITRFMTERNLKPKPWCQAAGIGENTLALFLSGTTNAPRIDVLYVLAEAAGGDITDLLDVKPPPVDKAAQRTVALLLERIRRDYAESGRALENIEALLQSLGASREDTNGSPPQSGSGPRRPSSSA